LLFGRLFPQPEFVFFVFVFVDCFGISQAFLPSTIQGIGNPPGDSKLFFHIFPIFLENFGQIKR